MKAGWEISCGLWKSGVGFGKEGWTAEQINNETVWKKDGNVVTDWSSYAGYDDSACEALDDPAVAAQLLKEMWESSCGAWKLNLSATKGWTSSQVGDKTVWKDKDGKNITNWSSYEGYNNS